MYNTKTNEEDLPTDFWDVDDDPQYPDDFYDEDDEYEEDQEDQRINDK